MFVIDSHTEGEPTRVILDGGPDLGSGSLSERAHRLKAEHWDFCSSVLGEPRGNDAFVGALLVEPQRPQSDLGVIFFNRVKCLGMCGHATMGLAATLAYLGRLNSSEQKFETPVGVVEVQILDDHTFSVDNVECHRLRQDVVVEIEGRTIKGDLAWGGNGFFITRDCPLPLHVSFARQLTDYCMKIRTGLANTDVVSGGDREIDHVVLVGDPVSPKASSRNFVLCPNDVFDRSPCGTGSSAMLACLAADGALKEGESWVQESIIGSTYELSYRNGADSRIYPKITGRAFVTAEINLIFDSSDPYQYGIPTEGK